MCKCSVLVSVACLLRPPTCEAFLGNFLLQSVNYKPGGQLPGSIGSISLLLSTDYPGLLLSCLHDVYCIMGWAGHWLAASGVW
jgi:hypothetical protein